MSFHSVDDNPPLARSVDRSQGHQVARCAGNNHLTSFEFKSGSLLCWGTILEYCKFADAMSKRYKYAITIMMSQPLKLKAPNFK